MQHHTQNHGVPYVKIFRGKFQSKYQDIQVNGMSLGTMVMVSLGKKVMVSLGTMVMVSLGTRVMVSLGRRVVVSLGTMVMVRLGTMVLFPLHAALALFPGSCVGERAGRMVTIFFFVTTAISHSNIINPSGLYVLANFRG